MTTHDPRAGIHGAGRSGRHPDLACRTEEPTGLDPRGPTAGKHPAEDRSTDQDASLQLASIASALVFLAGVRLVPAPYVLGRSAAGTGFDGYRNDVVVDVAVAVVALVRTVSPARSVPLGLINVGLGAWLMAAPRVLDYGGDTRATWNDIVVGAVVVVLASISTGSGLLGRERRGT